MTRLLAAALAFAMVAACGGSPGQPEVKQPPAPGGDVRREPSWIPNVRARLRPTSRAPAIPERGIEQTIWLDGARFRVRDEAGRDLYEILGDATAKRGLGLPAKSMEGIMGRRKAASRPSPGPTEIYGNLADDVGWVYPPRAAHWAKPARELAPLATQILAVDRPGSLSSAGPRATRVSRARPWTDNERDAATRSATGLIDRPPDEPHPLAVTRVAVLRPDPRVVEWASAAVPGSTPGSVSGRPLPNPACAFCYAPGSP